MIFTFALKRDIVLLSLDMLFKRNYSPSRRSGRQWINGSVQVFSGPQQFSAFGINLSDGGMGFFAAANLRVGSQVAIEFLPPDAKTPVRRIANIRHRALYLYGVEFLATGDHGIGETRGTMAQRTDAAAPTSHSGTS